jgi:hypothetical protein
MQKELTVFLICILALFADVLSLWQISNLWLTGFYGTSVTISLTVLACCLMLLAFALLRKIIEKLTVN